MQSTHSLRNRLVSTLEPILSSDILVSKFAFKCDLYRYELQNSNLCAFHGMEWDEEHRQLYLAGLYKLNAVYP
jgi:hypothetical protein